MNTGHTEDAQQAIKAAAQDALRTRGYVDYRRSFEAAARAQLMLNELAAHLVRLGASRNQSLISGRHLRHQQFEVSL